MSPSPRAINNLPIAKTDNDKPLANKVDNEYMEGDDN
jgi:hypothetical protein